MDIAYSQIARPRPTLMLDAVSGLWRGRSASTGRALLPRPRNPDKPLIFIDAFVRLVGGRASCRWSRPPRASA